MSGEGWKCPTCGSVYAPWVWKCSSCPGSSVGANTTSPARGCNCPTDTAGTKLHNPGCPLGGYTVSVEP